MNAREIGQVLDHIALLVELNGESSFKARSYKNAARALSGLTEDVANVVAGDRLEEIKGVGKGLSAKIAELATTGRLQYYDELQASVPEGLLALAQLPGLGTKRVLVVREKLGVTNVGELEYACRENRLAALAGFGAKTQANVLKAIEFRRAGADRHLYHRASAAAEALLGLVASQAGVLRADVTGGLRRHDETVAAVDILASTQPDARDAALDAFAGSGDVGEVISRSSASASVRLASGIPAGFRLVDDAEYPFALAHLTGSEAHSTAIRDRATDRGLALDKRGLRRIEAGESVDCGDESDIYRALGMSYVPELREDLGEIEAAERGGLPRLVEVADIRGMLHVHTDMSDGVNGLNEIVEAARRMGMGYLGICDHSQSAGYAGGLKPDRVREQWDAIDAVNERHDGITVLKGIESDVKLGGDLDYDDELLAQFDFVIASIHNKLGMDEAEATERVLRAIDHPATTILGHPTGRLLLARKGYPLDFDAVIERAAERGVAIELNASPHRLDLEWRRCREAKASGVKIAINPDAHSIAGMDELRIGVAVGRKGWLEAGDVLNALPVERVLAFARKEPLE